MLIGFLGSVRYPAVPHCDHHYCPLPGDASGTYLSDPAAPEGIHFHTIMGRMGISKHLVDRLRYAIHVYKPLYVGLNGYFVSAGEEKNEKML